MAVKLYPAKVVGILLAALYNPVWTVAVDSSAALIIALAAFGLLQFWKWSPWLLLLLSGGRGFCFSPAVAGAAISNTMKRIWKRQSRSLSRRCLHAFLF